MSLILDALNRSDSDRSGSDSTPGLHSVHGARGAAEGPDWRRWLWPGLSLAFALIAVFAWWGSGEEGVTEQAVAATPQSGVDQAPVVESRPVPAPTASPSVQQRQPQPSSSIAPTSPRPSPGVSDDVAALYSQVQAAGVDPGEVVEPPPEPAAARDAAPVPAEALAELQRVARAMEAPREAPATATSAEGNAYDVDALARAAQSQLESRPRSPEPLVQHEAPFITDLRQSQKDEIPSIFYSQHNWSSNPAERSVVLNGQERREGQQVKPGLRLVEILEYSIVLSFNGTEFQLRALNSWVNL